MSDRSWHDLTDEQFRRYTLADGSGVSFQNPIRVGIKRHDNYTGPGSPDSHVVETDTGGHYIARGWTSVCWNGKFDGEFGERVEEDLAAGQGLLFARAKSST